MRALEGKPGPWIAASTLQRLIRRDQLQAVLHSVTRVIAVNLLLGLVSMLVAAHSGRWREGLAWYSICLSLNALRFWYCRTKCCEQSYHSSTSLELSEADAHTIDGHLWALTVAALLSGLLWAALPALCDGYTSAQTVFFLSVTCGITAGAVTHGTAFARIPICFITPPLLSAAACLVIAGGFDRNCLAATVVLYLGSLIRGVIEAEKDFCASNRLKYQASTLALSAKEAHAKASELADEMRVQATHDSLSGLLNRAGFLQDAESRFADQKSVFCLMLLDLDGFKCVNDVYGHRTGDRVLIEVAKRIKRAVSHDCIVARLGGDEFAIFYKVTETDRDLSADLASHLIRAVTKPFESFDAGRLGISVGIFQAGSTHLSLMMSYADCAMYAAKAAGRNQYRTFDASLRSHLDAQRDCELELPQALADRRVEVWFQPIFRHDGRTAVGLEALVRWQHPVHGWIPPGELIANAALVGLADTLLSYILDEVCSMMSALRDEGLSSIRVSMNVSPREMAQVAVDEIVIERLKGQCLPPDMLEIEITEDTALDIDAVQKRLAALSEAGVRIALDDFGAGYSSLSALRQLGAGRLKIDHTLVTNLTGSSDKKGLIQAVLVLGRALEIEVVAEGVETSDDLKSLQALGCSLFQGYYLGRPAPAGDTLRMLTKSLVVAA